MFYDSVRRAEQTLGIFAGALTMIAMILGAIIPNSSSSLSAYRDGQLVQYSQTTTSLFQYLGLGLAGAIISAFVVLGVVFAAAAILHAREANPTQAQWMLALEWVAGALLALLAWATSILFIFLFIPAVALVVATLIVSTRRHFTAARA